MRALQGSLPKTDTIDVIDVIEKMRQLMGENPATKTPLLPLLSLRGKTYSLKDHFPFEPIFKVALSKRMLLKCARQVAKTTSYTADTILTSNTTPYLRTLFIAPRHDQIAKISTEYFKPFIDESAIKQFMVDKDCVQQVGQRSFKNKSTIFFSFAFLDCERVRGIPADVLRYDEIQSIDYDFIPVISSCADASPYGASFFSGTPLTLDNGIEKLWLESSRAEWAIPCFSCGHWNIACMEHDLLKMIGKETLVCAKCDRPVDASKGHWLHANRDVVHTFPGYHVPQPIMPMHYKNPSKWRDLIEKMEGKHGFTKQKFINETLGESADVGVKLITETDIRNASVLGANDWVEAAHRLRGCRVRVIGVDWGGGGKDMVSYTTVAAVGLNTVTNKVECHYAKRFTAGHTHDAEAREILKMCKDIGAHYIAHDFNGSGSVRETLIIQAGWPVERIIGFVYTASARRDLVVYNPPMTGEMRGYHSIDKARTLVFQAITIKAGEVLLPSYDTSYDVTKDMLALIEDKRELAHGSDVYLIRRHPGLSDDFAHALNFACVAIWHSEENWPDISRVQGLKMSEEQLELASMPNVLT